MQVIGSSSLSKLLLQYFEQRFDANQWEGATENGCRTSIQITLQQSDNKNAITHLVINDIAGERFEEMYRTEKNFNEIQSPLTNANNVIFLFDLIAWRQLSALLKETTESTPNWLKVEEERKDQTECGRAIADSHDLLVDLIERLKSASGMKQELIKRTFILAIPKCDFYIGEDMFLYNWVTRLTKDGYLKKLGDQDDSPYMATWNFPKELRKNNDDSIFNIALNGISKMSELAEEAIMKLSSPQENEEASSISAERIAQKISSTLIYLKNTFEDVKVVPVSALGRLPEKRENASSDFNAKAVPLFCEALLLLPMIKIFANKKDNES